MVGFEGESLKSNFMSNYIDGFVHPVPKAHLQEYFEVAKKVAEIWKEYGALEYHEYLGNDMSLDGVRSFRTAVDATEEEAVLFGWVVFPSKEIRDDANARVPQDPRMDTLIKPLISGNRKIFDASRMVYGGFGEVESLGS